MNRGEHGQLHTSPPRNKPSTHWKGCLGDPRAVLNVVKKGKIFYPYRDSNPRIVQSVPCDIPILCSLFSHLKPYNVYFYERRLGPNRRQADRLHNSSFQGCEVYKVIKTYIGNSCRPQRLRNSAWEAFISRVYFIGVWSVFLLLLRQIHWQGTVLPFVLLSACVVRVKLDTPPLLVGVIQ